MLSDDIPNQYSLIGENASIWLIVLLMLIGSIGSVAVVQLLLPPDLTIDTIKSWVIQSSQSWRSPEPPSPLNRTEETTADKAFLDADSAAVDSIEKQALAKLQRDEARLEAAPVPSLDATDEPITESSDAAVKQQASGTQTKPGETDSQDEYASTPALPDSGVDFISPQSLDAIVEPPKAASNQLQVEENLAGELEAPSMPAGSAANSAETVVAATDSEPRETATAGQDQPILSSHKAKTCPPLFFVHFERGGIRPIDPDLSIKVTGLHAWLSRHPEAKVVVEGHADSFGPEEWNLLISHRRAKMVGKILRSVGVPDTQIVLRALGEYAPLEGLPPESASNRRVSLRIAGVEACPTAIHNGENQ